MADLSEIIAGDSILPDDCRVLADSIQVDEYLGFGIMNTYFCDEVGTFAFRVYSQPDSVSVLMVVARLITARDEVDFSIFEHSLDWIPSIIAQKAGRQVHLNQPIFYFNPIAADPDYFTLEFLVEVIDSNDEFVSGVAISGFYEDPSGDTFPFEIAETEPNTVPEFRVDVFDKGIYTFVVTDVTGPGIGYAPSQNRLGNTVQQLVQAYANEQIPFAGIEGDPFAGTLSADVPEEWPTDIFGAGPAFFTAHAEDFEPWIESLLLGMPITRAGFSVQVLKAPSSATPVNQSYLEGVLNGLSSPPNCDSAPERYPQEDNVGVNEIEDLFRCDSDVITYYNVVKYDPSKPNVILLIQASGVQGMDFDFFRRFLDTVSWQPLGSGSRPGSGSERTVYLSRDSGAGYDDQTGEVWLTVAVVDGGESVYVNEFSLLILGPDGPDAFPFESTTGTFSFEAFFPGVYEFTVTGVGVEGATFDPTRSEAGPTFRVVANPGYDPAVDPTVHLFDGGSFVDEETGDLVFLWVVQDSNGDIRFEPVVTGYFVEPDGARFGFRSGPVGTDEIGTTFTINADSTKPGPYSFTVTHVSVDGAGYNPDGNQIPITVVGEDNRSGRAFITGSTLMFDTADNVLRLTVPIALADGSVPSEATVYGTFVGSFGNEREFEITPSEPFAAPVLLLGNPGVGVTTFTISGVFVPGAYYEPSLNNGNTSFSFERPPG
jgi:hypothetical protein